MEDDCDARVTNAWEVAKIRGSGTVRDCLQAVVEDLTDWSRNVLGDLAKRIKKLKVQLEECRRSILSSASIHREQVLRFKLERLEEQRDLMFKQRAHVNWLTKGDRNTKKF